MESMIKRDCERKDASAAVPGFGGVLDVLDSLLFAGPVAYALLVRHGALITRIHGADRHGSLKAWSGLCSRLGVAANRGMSSLDRFFGM